MQKRFCLFALPFSLVSLAASAPDASAQVAGGPSVTGILGTVQRCEPTDLQCGTSADAPGENPHPASVLVNALNFEDCAADLYYRFTLGVSQPSTEYELQAWAGTSDCSQLANRQTSGTSGCWPVMAPVAFRSNQFAMHVRMRDIASGAFAATHPVIYAPTTDPSVCSAQPRTGATSLTLYFFFTDAQSNPVGTVQQYPITLDLRSGAVQGNVSVTSADEALVVNVPATTDPDTQGYNVYCDPPPDGDADGGVGASADAGGTDAATQPGCASATLPLNTASPWLNTKSLCAQSGASSTSILVERLKSDAHYNVAVATVDGVGNIGPLSNAVCAESGDASLALPSPKSGSCSTQGAGTPAGTSGLVLLAAASSAVFVRRRKRASRASATV